jgi:hypothetical protein
MWETVEVHTRFWWGKLRERDHLEYLGVDGRIILRRIFRNWDGGRGIDWINLIEVRDSWLTLLNTVMNFRFPKDVGNFFTEDLLASQEGLCSV